MSKVQLHLSPRNPPPGRRRRWRAAVGGNTLTKLKAELVGERNTIEALPEGDPRRTPTLVELKFLALPFDEEEQS